MGFAIVPDGNKPEDENENELPTDENGELIEAKVVDEEQFIAEQAQKAADEAEIAEAFKKDENEANE